MHMLTLSLANPFKKRVKLPEFWGRVFQVTDSLFGRPPMNRQEFMEALGYPK